MGNTKFSNAISKKKTTKVHICEKKPNQGNRVETMKRVTQEPDDQAKAKIVERREREDVNVSRPVSRESNTSSTLATLAFIDNSNLRGIIRVRVYCALIIV